MRKSDLKKFGRLLLVLPLLGFTTSKGENWNGKRLASVPGEEILSSAAGDPIQKQKEAAVPDQTGEKSSSQRATDPGQALPDKSGPVNQLNPQEESAHTERVKRLQELLDEIVEEPAGAATVEVPQTAAPQREEATERLIESMENLEIQIRELNLLLKKASSSRTHEDEPKSGFRSLPEPRP